jgi:DNA topoisomerase-1
MPVEETCPDCGELLYRKKGRSAMLVCHKEGCGYKKKVEEPPKADDTAE